MRDKNFIVTYSRDISEKLKMLGFNEICSNNVDIYVFVNDTKLSFSDDIDMSKIKYSNKLFY